MTRLNIEFDGGTPCNIPNKGYGIGYGSYRIGNDPIVRINHGIPCSNNAAEILTLCCALESIQYDDNLHIDVYGDSKIALRQLDIAAGSVFPASKKRKMRSECFVQAIERLRKAVLIFQGRITTHWQPRRFSVQVFGH